MYYIGLDVHKKTISYCMKDAAGHVHREGKIGSTRRELDAWIQTLPQPPDDSHGSDDLHRLDLRLPASACREVEGSPSADAPGHRRVQEEKRPDRCQQDRRLPAMRLSARMPHGFDRDPGPAPYVALPAPGGEAGGADEKPYIGATHGKWGQL